MADLATNKVDGYFGPGGAAKVALGTALVGDTVESRLSRVMNVQMVYNVSTASGEEPLAATGLNTTTGAGSFLVDGNGTDAVWWVAIGV